MRRRRSRSPVPNLSDVAARAGVSEATVSRVLSGNHPVAAPTRERVRLAVRELGYLPPAGRPTGIVGVIASDLAVPFFSHLVRGIERRVRAAEALTTVLSTGGDPEEELRQIDWLIRQRAWAVILLGDPVGDQEHQRQLIRRAYALSVSGGTMVLCGRPPLPPETPAVTIDLGDFAGSATLATRLRDAGHRRIAFLGGPKGAIATASRLAGYRSVFAARGIEIDPELVRFGELTRAGGHRGATRLLDEGASFSAIMAGNDSVAIGALAALRAAGTMVPREVSVVGYDDIPMAAELALTTMRLPLEEIGEQAADAGLARRSARLRVHPTLVWRESVSAVAPPPLW